MKFLAVALLICAWIIADYHQFYVEAQTEIYRLNMKIKAMEIVVNDRGD